MSSSGMVPERSTSRDESCPWATRYLIKGLPEGGTTFRFSLLDDSLKKVYARLATGIASMDREIGVGRCPESDAMGVLAAALYDNPLLPNVIGIRMLPRSGRRLTVVPTYGMSKVAYERQRSALEEIGDRVSQAVEADPYEAELSIHDHLANSVEYSDGLPKYHDVAGPLLCGRGNCDGISKAASYLMRRCGLDVGIVTGVTNTGENHAWNMVFLDGGCYHLDVTWDLEGCLGRPKYDYFNISDILVGKTRVWSNAYQSTDLRYNYHSKNGVVIYREEDLHDVFVRLISRRRTRLEFRICERLIDDIGRSTISSVLEDVLKGIGGRYCLSYMEDTGCCHIDIEYL